MTLLGGYLKAQVAVQEDETCAYMTPASVLQEEEALGQQRKEQTSDPYRVRPQHACRLDCTPASTHGIPIEYSYAPKAIRGSPPFFVKGGDAGLLSEQ